MAVGRLELAFPVCLETFKDHPHMGRFTLRDEGMSSWYNDNVMSDVLQARPLVLARCSSCATATARAASVACLAALPVLRCAAAHASTGRCKASALASTALTCQFGRWSFRASAIAPLPVPRWPMPRIPVVSSAAPCWPPYGGRGNGPWTAPWTSV